MKLTNKQLKQIIQEELEAILSEESLEEVQGTDSDIDGDSIKDLKNELAALDKEDKTRNSSAIKIIKAKIAKKESKND
tara:strand:- start:1712 stop:1945 length:234 start_codon:yes stop_codon:yes gene_type:complete